MLDSRPVCTISSSGGQQAWLHNFIKWWTAGLSAHNKTSVPACLCGTHCLSDSGRARSVLTSPKEKLDHAVWPALTLDGVFYCSVPLAARGNETGYEGGGGGAGTYFGR